MKEWRGNESGKGKKTRREGRMRDGSKVKERRKDEGWEQGKREKEG